MCTSYRTPIELLRSELEYLGEQYMDTRDPDRRKSIAITSDEFKRAINTLVFHSDSGMELKP
jgi:hypothetical protein